MVKYIVRPNLSLSLRRKRSNQYGYREPLWREECFMGFQSRRGATQLLWLVGKRAESVEVERRRRRRRFFLFSLAQKRDKHIEGKRKELVNYDLEASGFAM
jgi:hypothetical protein